VPSRATCPVSRTLAYCATAMADFRSSWGSVDLVLGAADPAGGRPYGGSSFIVDSEMAKKAPEWWSHGERPGPASIHLDAAKGARRRRSNPRRCWSVRLLADGSRLAAAVAAPSVQHAVPHCAWSLGAAACPWRWPGRLARPSIFQVLTQGLLVLQFCHKFICGCKPVI
jgi:hypothetical protein